MESGRREHRMAVSLGASLRGSDTRPAPEQVSIENLSSHGARVLAYRAYKPHDHVILIGSGGDFHADAEVVYCQRVREGVCAVGLKFAREIPVEPLERVASGDSGRFQRLRLNKP
jgi:hypothetical protein